jgi:hypothetical protein
MREKSLALGRETTVARLWDTTSGMNTEMCGPLFDAEVILLKEGQMRVKGFEMVQVSSNPKTHQTYYQTWEVLLK